MDLKEITERQLDYEKYMLSVFQERLEACPPGYLKCKMDGRGGRQYYHKMPGDPHFYYINQHKTPLINELKYKRMLQEAVGRLKQNILAREKYLKALTPLDYDSISEQLPKAYQYADLPWEDQDLWQKTGPRFTQSENPFHREQLICPTTFGLMTRSRAEAYTAEMLYARKFTFHYEKKLYLLDEDGTQKVRYPDFTISIAPWSDYYVEVKGMYQNAAYRKRDEETTRLYHLNGIYPPRNLLIFMDGPDGRFHADSILQTIDGILVPLRASLSPQNPSCGTEFPRKIRMPGSDL